MQRYRIEPLKLFRLLISTLIPGIWALIYISQEMQRIMRIYAL